MYIYIVWQYWWIAIIMIARDWVWVIPSERKTGHHRSVKTGPQDAMGCIRGCWSATNCQASLHLKRAITGPNPPVDIQKAMEINGFPKRKRSTSMVDFPYIASTVSGQDQCLHTRGHSSHCTTFGSECSPFFQQLWLNFLDPQTTTMNSLCSIYKKKPEPPKAVPIAPNVSEIILIEWNVPH